MAGRRRRRAVLEEGVGALQAVARRCISTQTTTTPDRNRSELAPREAGSRAGGEGSRALQAAGRSPAATSKQKSITRGGRRRPTSAGSSGSTQPSPFPACAPHQLHPSPPAHRWGVATRVALQEREGRRGILDECRAAVGTPPAAASGDLGLVQAGQPGGASAASIDQHAISEGAWWGPQAGRGPAGPLWPCAPLAPCTCRAAPRAAKAIDEALAS